MFITMYHFRMLPTSIRCDFELPAWPYTEDEDDYILFRDYMRELTVFNYQDNELEDNGKRIGHSLEFGYNMTQIEPPFQAYLSQVHVSNSELKVIPNPGDRAEGQVLLDLLKKHPIAKDGMAWPSWNVVIDVKQVRNGVVQRDLKHEYLDRDLHCNSSCDTYKVEPVKVAGTFTPTPSALRKLKKEGGDTDDKKE